jgi:hypothetical protein
MPGVAGREARERREVFKMLGGWPDIFIVSAGKGSWCATASRFSAGSGTISLKITFPIASSRSISASHRSASQSCAPFAAADVP